MKHIQKPLLLLAFSLIVSMNPAFENEAVAEATKTVRPPNECDLLAASPFDEAKRSDGILFSILERSPHPAIIACEDARRQNPDDATTIFQLARSYHAFREYKDAAEYYELSGQSGNLMAHINLSGMHRDGLGVAANEKKAEDLLQPGARRGFAYSQYVLGHLYLTGGEAVKDTQKAVSWIQKAAAQRLPPAQALYGRMFLNGHGVKKDADNAIFWLQQAGKRGDQDALKLLAYIFDKGHAKPKNVEYAKRYILHLLKRGPSRARVYTDHLAVHVSKDVQQEVLNALNQLGVYDGPLPGQVASPPVWKAIELLRERDTSLPPLPVVLR